MIIHDFHAPRSIHSDADGFTDLVRRLDRAEPWRAGAGDAPELGFDEELRFEERRRVPKRTSLDRVADVATAASVPREPIRVRRRLPPMKKTIPGLRLVRAGEIDENLAVEDARMHARNKSLSWKQYLSNMDLFLGLQLDVNSTVGDLR